MVNKEFKNPLQVHVHPRAFVSVDSSMTLLINGSSPAVQSNLKLRFKPVLFVYEMMMNYHFIGSLYVCAGT